MVNIQHKRRTLEVYKENYRAVTINWSADKAENERTIKELFQSKFWNICGILNVTFGSFSFSFLTVNEESFGFQQLVATKKQLKDILIA